MKKKEVESNYGLSPKKKASYHKIANDIVRNLKESKYEKIQTYLTERPLQEIEKFYKQEGETILDWALTYAESSAPFEFILENIPLRLTINILEQNSWEILRLYIGARSNADEFGYFTTAKKNQLISILKVLLSVPSEYELRDAIESIMNKQNIADSVRQCYKEAKSQLEKEAHAKSELGHRDKMM